MNRKYLLVVLTVCLFAGAVGFGVHVMHKDALATETYTVTIEDDFAEVLGLQWIEIRFYLDIVVQDEEVGEGWMWENSEETGVYMWVETALIPNIDYNIWVVDVQNGDIAPNDPANIRPTPPQDWDDQGMFLEVFDNRP